MNKLIEKLHAKWGTAPLSAVRVIIALDSPCSQHQMAEKIGISAGHARYIMNKLTDLGFISAKLEKSALTEHKVRIYRLRKPTERLL